MKKILAVLSLSAFVSCGGAGLYPDTDVVEPKDFEPKVGLDVQKSGGLMLSGNLEYSGSGDLVQVYRDYVAAMRSHGWAGAADNVTAQKATGTLRKDNRTCALEFTSAGGTIKASIKVSQTK